MASITKRTWKTKGGKLCTGWRGRYKGADGRWKSTSGTTKGEVEKEIERRTGAVKLGVDPDHTATVSDGCKLWIDACKVGRDGRDPVEKSTISAYQSNCNNYIVPRIGGMRLSKITTPDCIRFRTELLQDLSRKQAKKIFTSYKAMLKENKVQGVIASDPAYGVLIRESGRSKPKVVIPVRLEIAAILRAADALATHTDQRLAKGWARRYRVLIRTAIISGLRGSELRGLPKGVGTVNPSRGVGLDLANGKIHVVQRADEYAVLGPPKSSNGYRTVNIPPLLVQELREHILKNPGPLVFGTSTGTPFRPGNVRTTCILPLMKQAKIEMAKMQEGQPNPVALTQTYGLKAFRHFYASMLIADGADALTLTKAMGHSSIRITMDNYGHLFPDDEPLRKARIDRLGAALLGALTID